MAKKNHHCKPKRNYSIFYDGLVTFEDLPGASSYLCDECLSLGYCKLGKQVKENSTSGNYQAPALKKIPFDIEFYKNKIPFRVSNKEGFSEFARTHLQTAYDSFHQEDYETALLHFSSVERAGAYNFERDYFLAVTNFLLERFQEASLHMQKSIDNRFFTEETCFV